MSKAIPRDPVSAYSHLIGAGLSVIGTIIMAVLAFRAPTPDLLRGFSAIIFGLSLIALYLASTIYHWYKGSKEVLLRLRKLDHAMIYVLIAGTYTPMLLSFLPLNNAIVFTCVIWAMAATGIIIKIFWFSAPRWLSTLFYIVMGWAIIAAPSAITSIAPGGIALLAAGGISYTVGGIIYAIKKPNISKSFGFHELFHIFVVLGSLLHYLVVVFYIL